MKVVAFNGSGRKDGNTVIMINRIFSELEKEGIDTELVQLAGRKIHGCTACYKCIENKDKHCSMNDDIVNECIDKMVTADAIILGSPTYIADMTAQMKALVDRAAFVARSNDNMFRRKVGAAVVAVRRAGAINVFDSINHFFLISEMVVPGSIYWNVAVGRNIGDVEKDEEGMRTMAILGQNMAWLLKKLQK